MGDSFFQRLFRGVRRVHEQPRWVEYVGEGWVDRIMDVQVADRFHAKQGRTIARWTLVANGRSLVVYLKRHYQLPRRHVLLALLFPGKAWSPALQEWEHLEWARSEGLPVPDPVAVGEFVGPGTRLQSFIAVEELTGMLPLHEAIPLAATRLSPAAFRRWKKSLLHEMVRITLALHQRGRFHKDLYLCHFYIAEADTMRVPDFAGRVRIIDLHRLGHHPATSLWWRIKDLAQLLSSTDLVEIDSRDRVRFWREYLASAGLGRWTLTLLRWGIAMKAWNFERRARRRRSREMKRQAA